MKNKFILLTALIIGLTACKNKKNLPDHLETPVGTINLEEFIGLIQSDTAEFKYLKSKAKLTVDNNGKTNSIKLFIKSTTDSAMLANVSVMAIPLARGLVSKDSLVVTQNRDKCYRRSSSDELQKLIPIAVDFDILQDIMHASSFGYDSSFQYYLIKENGKPVLSTHTEREIKWLEKNKMEKLEGINQMTRYYLDDSLNHVSQIRINFPADTGEVNIFYDKRQDVDGFLAPLTTRLSASNPRNSVHIKLEYDRVKLNKPHYLSLSIPDNYEPCP